MREGRTPLHLPDRVLWLDTASGSRYRIDPVARTWERLSHDARSDEVRTPEGPLLGLAAPPRVGERAVLVGPPLVGAIGVRTILTTPVVRIWDREPRVPHRAVSGWWAS